MDQECRQRYASGRTPSPPSAGPRNRNTSRVSSVTVTRTPVIEGDPTLTAIMSNVFAPMQYPQGPSQRATMSRWPKHENTGQVGAYDPSMNSDWSTFDYRKFENPLRQPSVIESTNLRDPRLALQQEDFEDQEEDETAGKRKRESLLEWFDRCVEKELRKGNKDQEREGACRVKHALQQPNQAEGLHVSQVALDKLSEAMELRMESYTELTEAVDNLAIFPFSAPMQTAEQCAEAAPIETAEDEQAAIGTTGSFQTDTTEVKSVVLKEKPT